MTINQLIGNRERKSTIDHDLYKKVNEGYSKLEEKFEKPHIELKPIEHTYVQLTTQDEYDALMQIYEIGNWKWPGEKLPTSKKRWYEYGKRTCISIGISNILGQRGYFLYTDKYHLEAINTMNPVEKIELITLEQFYDIQKIPKSLITEINAWFDANKPFRKSKG